MIEKWELVNSKKVFNSIPFGILRKTFLQPHQKGKFDAFVIEAPNWVNVVALNSEKEILLINQFRFGSENIEIEIPAGCIHDKEKPIDAIKRELEEETGFIAKKWNLLGKINANPAIQSNQCYIYLAEELKDTKETHFDPYEDIEHEFASIEQIWKYIQEEKITNAFSLISIFWYLSSINNPFMGK